MAEGGLKGSRSAEDLEKPGKPGKLSLDLLNKFVSDPTLTQPQALPVGRLSAQSFLSSSDETATSQETFASKKTANVRIKVPGEGEEHLSPSSTDEDVLSDDEAGRKKKKKKRKLRWKWSPFKKMRSLFRRKKNSRRAMSCEALPTERYKSAAGANAEDETLRNRAKSESSLTEVKKKTPLAAVEVHEKRNTSGSAVYRTQSDPSTKDAGELFEGLTSKQDKSQDDISEKHAVSSDSMHSGATALDWNMISSDGGTEAAVSFDNLPSASSLEGLQAAHDKIKIAPKHRRPPTRVNSRSSSMKLQNNPVKPHRRSKTDPKDLTVKTSVDKEQGSGSARNSDVINGTILEAQEVIDEQSKESAVADLKAKVNSILANLSESPRTTDKMTENGTEEKKSQLLLQREETKQGCVSEATVDSEQVEQPDNKDSTVIDKENKELESKQNEKLGSAEDRVKTEDKVLKELNDKKEVSRPLLDMNRRSESLQIFEVKGKSGKTGPVDKPPLPRGSSLDSFEPKEKTTDLKLTKVTEKQKRPESVKREQKSSGLQSPAEPKVDAVTLNQMELKASVPGKVGAPPEPKSTGLQSSAEPKVEVSRPLLDMSKRSESLQIFDVKGKSGNTGPVDKPPLPRGFSLDSFEPKEKTTDLKLTKVREKRPETVEREQNSSSLQRSAVQKVDAVTLNQMESKASLPENVQASPEEKDVKKAPNKEQPSSGQPSWIEMANKRRQRLSQLIEEDTKGDNKVLSKVATGVSSTPVSVPINNDSNKAEKPVANVKEKPKIPTKPERLVTPGKPRPISNTFNSTTEKKVPVIKPSTPNKPTVFTSVDKCAVCGTTVYQMERCSFDKSVLHKQCIKCTVCKRLLTVGNFVLTESKVYCKPHANTLTVA